jgi:hypothetical protein
VPGLSVDPPLVCPVLPVCDTGHLAKCPVSQTGVLPQTAVTIAKHHVLHAARTDYWWIKNQDEWIADGGTAAIGRVETRAAWAAKWSGLVRLTPAGLDGIAAVRSSALT